MGDDGFGPTVVRTLEAGYRLPPGVTVEDAGTPGLGFSTLLEGLDILLVVDTIKLPEPAGTLRVLRREEVFRHGPPPRMNPHEPGLHDALMSLELSDDMPRHFRIVGAVPGRVERGTDLTPALAAAVPRAVSAIVAELAGQGVALERRAEPAEPDLWWRRLAPGE
jgi:hydrogenase maturation protease